MVDRGVAEIRQSRLRPPHAGEVVVRTLFSGISRGTERLVFEGRVPVAEYERMAGPMQEGTFAFPVKYGYCAVGVVEQGPPAFEGRTVFALHPHQDRFIAPLDGVTLVPDHIPPRRATLSANMETALNALWDANAGPADRIAVVGGGSVGILVAHLASRLPGAVVTLIDAAPEREAVARALGLTFALPCDAPQDVDLVLHTSATEAGLATAMAAAGSEATVVEMSWYGEGFVGAPLGGAFHAGRLKLISSQVGHVAPSRRARWSTRRRLRAAIGLLDDPRLDVLVSRQIGFEELPAALPAILAADAPGSPPVVIYA